MSLQFVSLLSTVALLFSILVLGLTTPPLLVLKHDTPKDSRFVRGVFNLMYVLMILTGGAATVAYTLAGQSTMAMVLFVLTAFSYFLRRSVIGRMDALRLRLAEGDPAAVRPFKRMHLAAMGINVAQFFFVIACVATIRF